MYKVLFNWLLPTIKILLYCTQQQCHCDNSCSPHLEKSWLPCWAMLRRQFLQRASTIFGRKDTCSAEHNPVLSAGQDSPYWPVAGCNNTRPTKSQQVIFVSDALRHLVTRHFAILSLRMWSVMQIFRGKLLAKPEGRVPLKETEIEYSAL